MTTIIANRKMIVSDSKITIGDTAIEGPKLYRRNGAVIATAGDTSAGNKFLEWYGTNGIRPKLKKKHTLQVLVLTKAGLTYWDEDFEPVEISSPVYAIGTGGALAIMAVNHFGCSLEDAVRAACSTDENSGGAIQVMHLKAPKETAT